MELEKLFNSKRRAAVLEELAFAEAPLKASEIANSKNLDLPGVLRELNELKKLSILKIKKSGKAKTYLFSKTKHAKALKEFIKKMVPKNPWHIFEELPNGYFPYQIYKMFDVKTVVPFMNKFKINTEMEDLLYEHEQRIARLFIRKTDLDFSAQSILELFLNNSEWLEWTIREGLEKVLPLKEFSIKLKKQNLSVLTDRQLFSLFTEGNKLGSELFMFGWLQLPSYSENNWSNPLREILKKKINEHNSKRKVSELFVLLTNPSKQTLSAQEHRDILKIFSKIKKSKKLEKIFLGDEDKVFQSIVSENIIKDFQSLEFNYGFLTFGVAGPGNRIQDYISIVAGMIRQNLDFSKMHVKESKKLTQFSKDIIAVENELDFSPYEKNLFKAMRHNVWFKSWRKDHMFLWWSAADRILKEIARRKFIGLNQARMLIPAELNGKFPQSVELSRRENHCIFYHDMKKDYFFAGKKAETFLSSQDILVLSAEDVEEFFGDCACPGIARGKVTIVNEPKDIQKMKDGNILVSNATMPDLMPAIKKAAAIVTDVGGITSHASIISRELGIPCVIGTNIATKALHDGIVIEVNASHGKIKILK